MPRTIQFHLDEHINSAVADGLRRRGIGVTTTADAGLPGSRDADHVSFAVAEGRVIFTNDADFLRLHDQGAAHPGIVQSIAARAAGINPELLHRIASMSGGGLDSLPHNGVVITLLLICGVTHRQGYKDIAAVSVIGPLIATISVLALGTMFGSF